MKDAIEDKAIVKLSSEKEAREHNFNKFGIFFSINGFKERRLKENLLNINAWAVDIDKIDKDTQVKIITRSPIPPSLIIESKNGYHVYWLAKDGTKGNYKEIVEVRLIPFFQADIRAKDICRILRLPGYWHWKDENDPFLIQEVFRTDIKYTEREMMFFPSVKSKSKYSGVKYAEKYDNMDALKKLSGCHEVKGETFDFARNVNGSWQIMVNGKKTSSWIDKQGYIGSYDRGGCTWINWLKWYGLSGKEAIKTGESYGIRTE